MESNIMFSSMLLHEFDHVIRQINPIEIEEIVREIKTIKDNRGRLFILGVGGSAATAAHGVNDFRKLVNIEAYAPTDGISELTARTNDDGWDNVFVPWLMTSHFNSKDGLLILSVGGGDIKNRVSLNLVNAALYAKAAEAKVMGVIGRYGGEVGKIADVYVKIPLLYPAHVTPITESAHSLVLHILVTHPMLAENDTKW